MDMLIVLLAIVLGAVLLFAWLKLRVRFEALESRVAALTRRVYELETRAPAMDSVPVDERAGMEKPEEPVREEPAEQAAIVEPTPIPESIRLETPGVHKRDRLRRYFGDDEWEALVGGSLLNKIGALILVIGLALFLGFSFTHMGPAGRALTCVAVSWSLLGTGIFLERKAAYRTFARGLIGAGWAALYITAYAIYALPAAQLIHNSLAGSMLVLLVAIGMIAHSLRYRTQAVTAVAYFAAFAALAVTPSSALALVGLLPLAASLLVLAYGLNWNVMALFGAVATYACCLWRGDSNASLFESETLLLVYWLLFESFDLLRVAKGRSRGGLEYLFPINALAFMGLSYRAWSSKDAVHVWIACGFAAALYAVSSLVRWFVRPQDRDLTFDDFSERVKAGSFEAPLVLSAALAGIAITLRAVGVWVSAGLAIEAEVLYVTGVLLDLASVRALGRLAFGLSIARLLGNDIEFGEVLGGSIASVHAWTPVALFHAFLFYANRLLKRPNAVFSSLAAALVAGALAQELPNHFLGTSWLLLAALLFEIGLRSRCTEFRYQAYALAVAGVVSNIWFHVLATWAHPGIPLGLALVILYALLLRVRGGRALPEQEHKWLELAGAAAITAVSMLLVGRISPEHYEGLLLCALAWALLELGLKNLPGSLVRSSYVAGPIAALVLVTTQGNHFTKFPSAYVWISYFGAAIVFYGYSERAGVRSVMTRMAASAVAVCFGLCGLALVLSDAFVGPAWAAVGFALFLSGLQRDRTWERWQGYVAALLSVGAAGIAGFPWASAIVAGVCFAAEFLSPHHDATPDFVELAQVERHLRTFWSVLGTFVLAATLWSKFPGGWLSTAWGIEGVTLMVAGFAFSERILRLQGLAMLAICILKLFLYDLRNLETPYRILSFIALGVILLAVSSLYTRFREQIRRQL